MKYCYTTGSGLLFGLQSARGKIVVKHIYYYHRLSRLHWIVPGAPLNFSGAPEIFRVTLTGMYYIWHDIRAEKHVFAVYIYSMW